MKRLAVCVLIGASQLSLGAPLMVEGDDAEMLFRHMPRPVTDESDVFESRPFLCRTENDNLVPAEARIYRPAVGFHCTRVNANTNGHGVSTYLEYATEMFRILKDAGVKIGTDGRGPSLRVQSVKCSRKVKEAKKGFRCEIVE